MEIYFSKISGLYETQALSKPAEVLRTTRAGEKLDMISLSDRAKEFNAVMSAVRQSPDIRTEKVEALKSTIQNGSYKISADAIAAKIVKDYFSA